MKPSNFIDMTGMRFGRLVALRQAPTRRPGGPSFWLCCCDCGVEKEVAGNKLRSGRQMSCGCYHRDICTTHGGSKSQLYTVWHGMKGRCLTPSFRQFEDYGGRGIKLCPDWMEFAPFAQWADDSGYEPGLTLDRMDNDGDYVPANCRWATRHQQARNRSNNLCAPGGELWRDKAVANGINASAFYHRVCIYGWDPQRASSEPMGKPRRKPKTSASQAARPA